jgi:histone-lysine N-methyltransferase SETMAR
MTSVFWDSEEVIHVYFLPHGIAINAQYYSNLLHNDVHQELWKKRPGKLSKIIILLHDNAHPHTENLKVTLATIVGWEIMDHPPYSHDLTPRNIHLFGPKQKFQTNEQKCGVLNWIHSQDKIFSATGISNLSG